MATILGKITPSHLHRLGALGVNLCKPFYAFMVASLTIIIIPNLTGQMEVWTQANKVYMVNK
jgi:hypothetical protein